MTKSIAAGETAIGVVQPDPTALLRAGEILELQVQGLALQLSSELKEGAFPLGLFQGALLAMTFRNKRGDHTTGSAVLVAPGVALCASHVIGDHEAALRAGECWLLCSGPVASKMVLWMVKSFVPVPKSDLTLLCMTMASEMPPGNNIVVAHPSTRTPAIGEIVTLYGIPAKEMTAQPLDGKTTVTVTARYTRGKVLDVHPEGRDRVMLPFPCFAVDCAAFGGMSGGPVCDERGYLVGVVASSYNGEEPVAYVSLLWPALLVQLLPAWPAQRPLPMASLLEIASQLRLCFIERPDAILAAKDAQSMHRYTPWT